MFQVSCYKEHSFHSSRSETILLLRPCFPYLHWAKDQSQLVLVQTSSNGKFVWRLHQPGYHLLRPVPPSSCPILPAACPFTGSDLYWGLKPVLAYSCFLPYALHRVFSNKSLAPLVLSWLLLLGGLDLTYSQWQSGASHHSTMDMHTSHDPAIPLLHIYSTEMHIYFH